jgi:hypothetical protein
MKALPLLLAALTSGVMAEPTTYRKFSVEESEGSLLACHPIAEDKKPLWAKGVAQGVAPERKKDRREPYFEGPITYVRAPRDAGEPFHSHNHQPSITWLPNGDLLAIWYSTKDEKGPELTVLASRLRHGAKAWDASSEFFKAEGRNMHGSSIFHDGSGTIYHFNGMAPEGHRGWDKLALLMRKSSDNGVTWSEPLVADPEYRERNQVIAGMRKTKAGVLIQPCDAVPGGAGGTALNLSRDGGATWTDPGEGKPSPKFTDGAQGLGTIAGIHASVVELKDGDWLAFGRGDDLPGGLAATLDLLSKTVIRNVKLPEQTFEERVEAIEAMAREAGIAKSSLELNWADDEGTQSSMSIRAVPLFYDELSLAELVRYSTDKTKLNYRFRPRGVTFYDATSSKGPAPFQQKFMPQSISNDEGKTWTYAASPFPPIGGGQRLTLLRLQEGPLLLISFTNPDRRKPREGGMEFSRADGSTFTGHGMFAAISEDEGKSWPIRKLITPGAGEFDGGAWTRKFTATPDNAEHAGYLASTQSPDGTIHLISSALHYRFNLAWLREAAASP